MSESNSERLTAIKNRDAKFLEGTMLKADFEWLIEQAEENIRLREALRFYADRRHYHREYDPFERTYEPSSLDMDFGRKAEQALEDRK